MIKVQDFARECGVTDRQVHRLLSKYEAEVEGLFERRGQNGTWLSAEACEILRGKMKRIPPAVIDEEANRKNEKLQKRIDELEARLSEKEKLVEMAQRRADALQESAGKVYALEEGKKLLEERIQTAAADLQQAQEAAMQAQAAQRAAELEAEKLRAELEAERSKPIWKRIFGR